MSDRVSISREEFAQVAELIRAAGGVEAAQAALRRPADLRVDRLTATEALALFEAGMIDKRELRKFLGLRGTGPVRRPPQRRTKG